MSVHWLVRLEFAGRVFRWSDTPVDPVDSDGKSLPHLGGLPELRAPSDYDPFKQRPSVASVSLEVSWPPDDPLADIVAAGHRFQDATAEVSLWTSGTSYAERKIIASGSATEPEYGPPDQPVAFTVEGLPWEDSGSTHLQTWRVTTDTWPQGDHDGEPWYPVVWGRPAWSIRELPGTAFYEKGSPARVVKRSGTNAQTLLIAGHAVSATQVTIVTGVLKELFAVIHQADGLGQLVSVVDVSGASIITLSAESFAVAWTAGSSYPVPDGKRAGAGDLLTWILSRFQIPVDYSGLLAWRAWLNRFSVSGFIVEPTSPWRFITDGLLGMLPITVQNDGGTLRVIPWRYDARYSDAIREIEVGPGVTMPGRIVHETDEVRSRFQLSTSMLADGDSRLSLILSPDQPTGYASTSSRVIHRAKTLVGDALETMEESWIGDTSTAFLVLHWRSVRGLVTRYVELQDITGEYDELHDGDVVTVTHSEAGIQSRLGIVARDYLSPVAQTLRVIILPEY
jgi:hypothetical protein